MPDGTLLPRKNGPGLIIKDPKERGRFFRFAIVGTIGAVVDFGVFNLLTILTPISAVLASVFSFTAAFLSNFTWNRLWTYPDSRSKRISHQMGQFLLVSLVGLGIRTPLFAWLEGVLITSADQMLPADFFLSARFIGHNVALAIAIIVVMIWNFFANRYWTYGDIE
jgi:putative flippase GtrA